MPLIRAEEFNEDLEDKTVSKEGEYELRILKGEYKATKAGDNNMVIATLAVDGPDGEGLAPFNHYMVVPNGGEYDRMRKRDLKRFLAVFGVDFANGWDPEEDAAHLAGQTGKCMIKLEKGDDGNLYPRLRLPKLES